MHYIWPRYLRGFFMLNFNGDLISDKSDLLSEKNRAFRYGDGLFESIRTFAGKIYFWEDHYFRLMASMRILRMEIPMEFTMENLSDQIGSLLEANKLQNKAARVRLSVYRNDGGFYNPVTHDVSFVISAEEIQNPFYVFETEPYRVDLFKEHYLNPGLLSTLKTNNRILNVVGSIYAKEAGLDNLILLNQNKQVAEALQGNIFLVKDGDFLTPPLTDGCLNGIIRKKIIELAGNLEDITLQEKSISPFELQQADELFITNAIMGIRSVTNYRRKEYRTETAANILGKLNAIARLG